MNVVSIAIITTCVSLIVLSFYLYTEYRRLNKTFYQDPRDRASLPSLPRPLQQYQNVKFYECLGYTEPRDSSSMSLVLLADTSETLAKDVTSNKISKVLINAKVHSISLAQSKVNIPTCFPLRSMCQGDMPQEQQYHNVFKVSPEPGEFTSNNTTSGLNPMGRTRYTIFHVIGYMA